MKFFEVTDEMMEAMVAGDYEKAQQIGNENGAVGEMVVTEDEDDEEFDLSLFVEDYDYTQDMPHTCEEPYRIYTDFEIEWAKKYENELPNLRAELKKWETKKYKKSSGGVDFGDGNKVSHNYINERRKWSTIKSLRKDIAYKENALAEIGWGVK